MWSSTARGRQPTRPAAGDHSSVRSPAADSSGRTRWEELLLAHADRTRVLPEEYRKTVIKKNGDVLQTFLVDGFVAGLWREERGRIVLERFKPIRRTVRDELGDEAIRLSRWLR